MKADDPRHGSERGHEQHCRDGETPCDPCLDAKLRAARRRTKRKAMGHKYTMPLGTLHATLTAWRDGGASLDDIGHHVDLESSVVWRLINGGPNYTIYARTHRKIAANRREFPITTIGVTRRIQALTWLGYSVTAIADAADVNQDTILDGRKDPREFFAHRVKRGVAEAYERLHMHFPDSGTRQGRAGITRVRNAARREGYLPPLAWTDIDDAREHPTGWEYREHGRRERADILDELDQRYAGLDEVCRYLKVTRDAVEKWCQRNDATDLYTRLVDRNNHDAARHRNTEVA